jgi:hypothetical protein
MNNKIHLHSAKCVVNEHAYIYKPEVLHSIDIDSIVRISYIADCIPFSSWSHDAPFVRIIKKDNLDFLGKIIDFNRLKDTNKYLLNVGEKIWFNTDNIIEIISEPKFQNFLTKNKLQCTGPLFTVESESDSDNSGYSSVSDSD